MEKKTTLKQIEETELSYNQIFIAMNGLRSIHLTKITVPDVKNLGLLFENERLLEPHYKAITTKFPEDEKVKEFAMRLNKLERALTATEADFKKLEEEYKDTLEKEEKRQKEMKIELEKTVGVKGLNKIPSSGVVPNVPGDFPVCRALSIFYK